VRQLEEWGNELAFRAIRPPTRRSSALATTFCCYDLSGQAWAGTKAWTTSTRVPSASTPVIVASNGPLHCRDNDLLADDRRAVLLQQPGVLSPSATHGCEGQIGDDLGRSPISFMVPVQPVAYCPTRVEGS